MKLLALILVSLPFTIAGSKKHEEEPDSYCPLASFKPNTDFDMTKFQGRWFVQKAQDTTFTPQSQMYCIRQTWTIYNSISNIGMDYESRETSAFGNYLSTPGYNATIKNPDEQGAILHLVKYDILGKISLSFTPGSSPLISSTPFWVIDTRTIDRRYEWAIVSGGSPGLEYNGKCITNGATTGKDDIGDVGKGLWYLTRSQDIDSDTMKQMDQAVSDHGIDSSVAKNVTQRGCVYNS